MDRIPEKEKGENHGQVRRARDAGAGMQELESLEAPGWATSIGVSVGV